MNWLTLSAYKGMKFTDNLKRFPRHLTCVRLADGLPLFHLPFILATGIIGIPEFLKGDFPEHEEISRIYRHNHRSTKGHYWNRPDILDSVKLGLDLKGGFEILYEASPLEEGQRLPMTTSCARRKICKPVLMSSAVSGTRIYPEGKNRIRVRIAGVDNIDEVRQRMKDPAVLTFRSNDGCAPDEGFCKIELRGTDFVDNSASVQYNELNEPFVTIKLKDASKFYEVTSRLTGNVLAIMLDDEVLSAPRVNYPMSGGSAQIEGDYTPEEAKQLADTINLGALPLQLTEKYIQQVDATLGQASLDKTMTAGVIG